MIINPVNNRERAVYQYDLQGNIIKLWNNIVSASKELNIYHTRISDCCRGVLEAGGYI